MSTPDEHPIEPLSDAAWARIERQLFERSPVKSARLRNETRRPPRTRWAAGVVAVAAAAVLAVSAALHWTGQPEASTQRYAAQSTEREVSLPGLTLRLEPSAVVQISEDAAATSCKLEHGAVRFEVAPRAKQRPLFVEAAAVRVEVVGTVFRVARSGTRVSVATYAGKVQVHAAGQRRLVARGEHWTNEPAVDDGTAQPPSAAAPAAPSPGVSTARSEASNADEASAKASPPEVAADAARSRAAGDQPKTLPPPRSPAQRTVPPTAAASERTRFEAAADCETQDPARALRQYRELTRGQGAWAQNALFALGRLELQRGLEAEAARDLRAYLQRYPNGANALDARALLQALAHQPLQAPP